MTAKVSQINNYIMSKLTITWNEEYRRRFDESPKVRAHLADFIAQASLPKPPEQREKMRQAKLGKPKTDQHKANMSEAHKFRCSLKKEIQAKNPELPINKVWDLVRMEMSEE